LEDGTRVLAADKVCDTAVANYFEAVVIAGEIAYAPFTWTTGLLYTNPKFLTTFRGRGEFASGSFSTTN